MIRQADGDFSKLWKKDWAVARQAYVDWWNRKGLALHVIAPRDEPCADFPDPGPPKDLRQAWLDPGYRTARSLYHLSRTFFGGIAHPTMDTGVGGPGSLGLFLGCNGELAPSTVWYEPPVMHDYASWPPLRFQRNQWWDWHVAAAEEALRRADGHYLVEYPDLIENIDTLAQLRGPQQLLMDLLEQPAAVKQRIGEINAAFFAAFDALGEYLRDPWGGNDFIAFRVWGPGKTAKVQCDFACMISAAQFAEFVQPALTEQCNWLDYSLFHLDGTNATHQLPNLYAIERLNAIEFTPQSGRPGGGNPCWYDLYRDILANGKGVQAIGVACDEVEPLIEAVGAEGLFIMTWAPSEAKARDLLRRVSWPGDC